MTGTSKHGQNKPALPKAGLAFVGPALATGIAYIDPGNVATNLTGGARFGYALIWVIVFANLGAWLVQYLAAKLAIASGKSMSQLLGEVIKKRWLRLLYWLQAELMILATELAEVVGGAIALHLLFGLNPVVGAIIVADHSRTNLELGLAVAAIILATINMVGGFVVTDRMLEMFKPKKGGEQK